MSQVHVHVVVEAFLTFVLWSQDSRKLQGHSWLPYISVCGVFGSAYPCCIVWLHCSLGSEHKTNAFCSVHTVASCIMIWHSAWNVSMQISDYHMLCTDVFLLLFLFVCFFLPVHIVFCSCRNIMAQVKRGCCLCRGPEFSCQLLAGL